MEKILKRILLFGILAVALNATTMLTWNQVRINAPLGTGTFWLSETNGVISWLTSPVQTINFSDAEIPTGTINGTNTVFTLAHTPLGTSLLIVRNGIVQQTTIDYTLSGTSITFVTASVPLTGDSLQAWYRY